jgi:hypothetical protein
MQPDELKARRCRKEKKHNGEVIRKVDAVKVDVVK